METQGAALYIAETAKGMDDASDTRAFEAVSPSDVTSS